jgi:hypothetical protein
MLEKLIELLVNKYIYITSTYKTDTPFSAEGKCKEVLVNSKDNEHFLIIMEDGKDFGIRPNVFRKKWVEQKGFRKISL